jgi:peptide/nickel transport system substrate-binding protein
MKLRHATSLGALVTSLVLVSTAGAFAGASDRSHASSGSVLRIGMQYQVDSMNPFVALESSSLAVYKYIYPSLVQYNNALTAFAPNFATSWSTSPSGLDWTFHLHSGAMWSDGKPLTSADVVWTVNTVLKDATGGSALLASYLPGVNSASAPDANTVVIHLQTPEAAFLANIGRLPILAQHVWSQYDTGTAGSGLRTFANAPTTSQPVVSGGPFMATAYNASGVTLFSVNPNFYGVKPTISGFGLEYFTSADAEIQALKTGQIDVMLNATPSAIHNLKADPSLVVDTKPALNESDFIINDYKGKKKNRELLNPLVHQAFNYAINRNAIVKNAFNGDAKPGMSIIPVADKAFYDTSVKPAPFSIAKANALMNKAGYKMGSNGVRIANGHPMSYTVVLATDEEASRLRAFDIIQSDFKQIGVQLKVSITDDATAASLELTPSQKFDLGMWGWTPSGPDPTFLLNTYTCAQFGGWQETGYCNKTYDKLFAQQSVTMYAAKRRAIVFRMQKMLATAMPEFIYAYENVNDVWNKAWSGFAETPGGLFSPLTINGITYAHHA